MATILLAKTAPLICTAPTQASAKVAMGISASGELPHRSDHIKESILASPGLRILDACLIEYYETAHGDNVDMNRLEQIFQALSMQHQNMVKQHRALHRADPAAMAAAALPVQVPETRVCIEQDQPGT